jgi:hypothetical protein
MQAGLTPYITRSMRSSAPSMSSSNSMRDESRHDRRRQCARAFCSSSIARSRFIPSPPESLKGR